MSYSASNKQADPAVMREHSERAAEFMLDGEHYKRAPYTTRLLSNLVNTCLKQPNNKDLPHLQPRSIQKFGEAILQYWKDSKDSGSNGSKAAVLDTFSHIDHAWWQLADPTNDLCKSHVSQCARQFADISK